MKSAAQPEKTKKTKKTNQDERERLIKDIEAAKRKREGVISTKDKFNESVIALEQRCAMFKQCLSDKQNTILRVEQCIEKDKRIEELVDQHGENGYVLCSQESQIYHSGYLYENPRNVDELLQLESDTINRTEFTLFHDGVEDYTGDVCAIAEILNLELGERDVNLETIFTQLTGVRANLNQMQQYIAEHQKCLEGYENAVERKSKLTEEIDTIQKLIEDTDADIRKKNDELMELKTDYGTINDKLGKLVPNCEPQESVDPSPLINCIQEKMKQLSTKSTSFSEQMESKSLGEKIGFICQSVDGIPYDKTKEDVIKAENEKNTLRSKARSLSHDLSNKIPSLTKSMADFNTNILPKVGQFEKTEREIAYSLITFNKIYERKFSYMRSYHELI